MLTNFILTGILFVVSLIGFVYAIWNEHILFMLTTFLLAFVSFFTAKLFLKVIKGRV